MISEKRLSQNILDAGVLNTTPGLKLEAYLNGKKKCSLDLGKTYDIYDLASVTKIIFGASLAMDVFEDNKKLLQTPVKEILPWFIHKKVKVGHLLSHTSGLVWWRPFYKNLIKEPKGAARWQELIHEIRDQKLEHFGKAIYSDVGYITMGLVMREIRSENFYDLWLKLQGKRKLPAGLHFNVENKLQHKKSKYAPTEKGLWRKKKIQGEVNDDNTWALGGVSVHAGLFGGIEDLSEFGLVLRNSFLGKNKFLADKKTIRLFTKRAIPQSVGDWGYGFMKPTKGSASCGKYFSLDSFGHLGFTGTSLWYDPKRDLLITIVSNRTWYGRETNEFAKMRPSLHNLVVEALEK
ncbi:MAG: serine hydrolase domain-containing protein [Pseudobdellovibrionaceae bacterium]